VQLQFTEAAKTLLAEKGYNPEYGARPLRRAIQRLVEDPLSEEMLKGTFEDGDVIEADAEGDKIVFRKAVQVTAEDSE
jgi:ATP-dependent Clp protease ATP-binding subunit ClpC